MICLPKWSADLSALDCTVTYKINSTDKAGEFCLEPRDGVGLGHWTSPRCNHILGVGDEVGLSTEALQYQLGQDDCIESFLRCGSFSCCG